MRKGDFSKLVNSTGQTITIYDPFTATYDCQWQRGEAASRFPGNIIPANRINPIALAVTQYMPLPNRAAPAGFRYADGQPALPGLFDKDKFYNLILKFDRNFGSKHRAFFRHASNDRTEDRAVTASTISRAPMDSSPSSASTMPTWWTG